jgi:pseudouridine synthase
MRLNKFVASATGVSRREADEMISRNCVQVLVVNDFQDFAKNTRISPEDFAKIDEDSAGFRENIMVKVDGEIAKLPEKKTLIMLNKPRGYVSSRAAQTKFAKTLYELLPERFAKLKTVGRLDKDSSGLILLTDDGDLAQQMTHPSFAKNKTYLVRLDRDLEPLHQQMISDFGVDLADGKSRLFLTRISEKNELSENEFAALTTDEKFRENGREIWRVQMSEGRNRQIRRTFSALGYEVLRLHRTEFGEFQLGEIASGEVREIHRK